MNGTETREQKPSKTVKTLTHMGTGVDISVFPKFIMEFHFFFIKIKNSGFKKKKKIGRDQGTGRSDEDKQTIFFFWP